MNTRQAGAPSGSSAASAAAASSPAASSPAASSTAVSSPAAVPQGGPLLTPTLHARLRAALEHDRSVRTTVAFVAVAVVAAGPVTFLRPPFTLGQLLTTVALASGSAAAAYLWRRRLPREAASLGLATGEAERLALGPAPGEEDAAEQGRAMVEWVKRSTARPPLSEVLAFAAGVGANPVRAEHALLALEHDPEVRALLEGIGIDLAGFFEQLSSGLAEVPAVPGAPTLDDSLYRAAFACWRGTDEPPPPATFFVRAVLASPPAQDALKEHGGSTNALASHLAHGRPPARPELDPAAAGPHAVRLYNDDFTTQELVVDVLIDVLGVSVGHAHKLMTAVHHGEARPVFTGPAAEALAHAQAIHDAAHQAGCPLRVEVVPVG